MSIDRDGGLRYREALEQRGGVIDCIARLQQHQCLQLARVHRAALLSRTSTQSRKQAIRFDSPANILNPNNMISTPGPGKGTAMTPPSNTRVPRPMMKTALRLNPPLLLCWR